MNGCIPGDPGADPCPCQPNSNKVTVQWCIISEALTFENHGYGSLVRGDFGDEKTYHHNLYAHNPGRNPRPGNYTDIGSDPEGLHFDFRMAIYTESA